MRWNMTFAGEWIKDKDDLSWTWDESYTMPENLFLAYQRGAGQRYYDLGLQYLDDKTWFDPLSRNENVLNGRHAYSYVNSLSSAMMAYLVAGSEKHLRAARNAFAMLQEQSFATGGWGPDETLRAPGSNDVYEREVLQFLKAGRQGPSCRDCQTAIAMPKRSAMNAACPRMSFFGNQRICPLR